MFIGGSRRGIATAEAPGRLDVPDRRPAICLMGRHIDGDAFAGEPQDQGDPLSGCQRRHLLGPAARDGARDVAAHALQYTAAVMAIELPFGHGCGCWA